MLARSCRKDAQHAQTSLPTHPKNRVIFEFFVQIAKAWRPDELSDSRSSLPQSWITAAASRISGDTACDRLWQSIHPILDLRKPLMWTIQFVSIGFNISNLAAAPVEGSATARWYKYTNMNSLDQRQS